MPDSERMVTLLYHQKFYGGSHLIELNSLGIKSKYYISNFTRIGWRSPNYYRAKTMSKISLIFVKMKRLEVFISFMYDKIKEYN